MRKRLNYISDKVAKEALQVAGNDAERRKIVATVLRTNCVTRFRPLTDAEKILTAIEEDKLYFSAALGYNDLYDTLMYVDYTDLFGYIQHCLNTYMGDYLKEALGTGRLQKWQANWVQENFEAQAIRTGFLEWAREEIEQLKHKVHQNIKGICFSDDMLSTLMWSHYADNHRGIALLYDKKELTKAACYNATGGRLGNRFMLCKVKYREERVDATEYISDYFLYREQSKKGVTEDNLPSKPNDKVLKDIILTKSKPWGYEKEYRLLPIDLEFEQENEIAYLSIVPKAIVMGAQISTEDRKRVIAIAKKKGILLYEVWLNDSQKTYNLVFQRVDDSK